MFFICVLPLLFLAAVGIFVAMSNRLTILVNNKGYGNALFLPLLGLFWFGGLLVSFFVSAALLAGKVRPNLSDQVGAVFCGLPVMTLFGGVFAVLPVFLMAVILPAADEKAAPRRRQRRTSSGLAATPTFLVVGVSALAAVACVTFTSVLGVGAYLYATSEPDDDPNRFADNRREEDRRPRPDDRKKVDDPPPKKIVDPPRKKVDDPPPKKFDDPPPKKFDDPPPKKFDDPPFKEKDPPPKADYGPSINGMMEGKFVKPQAAAGATTYLQVVSSPGDYIGQGKAYAYPNAQMTIKADARGLHINVEGWSLNFAGPGKQPLNLGEYRNAERYPFNGANPGLSFSGMGRGSNSLSGEFIIWQLEHNGVQITRLAADFVQRDNGRGPPLFGVIRYNSGFK
jgi:hypothetical protein